ncbi:MAG TPA: FecR domain-containing protein [Steroidobacteraceae bacterium]|nr:FecR domain-containing protein [Steroidobacteraceae bacterium]
MSCHNAAAAAENPVVRFMTALSVTLFAWCASPAAFALDTGDIVVTSIKGDVRITVNGAPRALKAGGVLETPASVHTGKDGALELKQGATTVSVGPDTQLEFPAREEKGGSIDRVVQPRGNAFYSIGKRDGHKLRVEAPYLVGVVKGTQFNVAAQDTGTTISLFEGRLEVRATDGDAVVDLNAGEIASRRRGDKSINVMKMDGKVPTTAPRPTSSGNGGGGGGEVSLLAGGGAAPGLDTRGDATMSGADPALATTSIDTGTGPGVGIDAAAGIDAGTGANAVADANVGAGGNSPLTALDLEPAVSANVGLGVTQNAITAGIGAAVDTGPVSAGLGVDAGITAGPANLGVDAGTTTTADLGVVNANVGTNTAVDVGTSGVGAAVDAGAGVNLGTTSVVDTSTSATVDVGANTAVGVNTNTAVAGVDTGVAAAVNANAGTVDVGVNVAGLNVNVGVDLGLDDGNNGHGNDAGHNDTSNPGNSGNTTPPASTPVIDVGGLLDGLVRRRRK